MSKLNVMDSGGTGICTCSETTLGNCLKTKIDGNQSISFAEGWHFLNRTGIAKLHQVLRGGDMTKHPFSTSEFADLYNLTFLMCGHHSHVDNSLELYRHCKESIESFLVVEMIPMLRGGERGKLVTACNTVEVHLWAICYLVHVSVPCSQLSFRDI